MFASLLYSALAGLHLSGSSLAASSFQDVQPPADEAVQNKLDARAPSSIHAYYNDGGERLWTGGWRARRRLEELVSVLGDQRFYGFNPDAYGRALLTAASRRDEDRIEAAASYIYTSLARDLLDGRRDPLIDWNEERLHEREAGRAELLAALQDAGSVEDVLECIREANPVEAALTEALATYTQLSEEKAWGPITLSSELLEEGDEGDDVTEIQERLAAEGFFRMPRFGSPDPVYDERLAEAVNAFQESRGIVPDGVVGPSTLARMNETPAELVELIRLNLERARWLPQDFAERRLVVNIADFTVSGFDDGEKTFSMRTVVGDQYNKTPIFADEMEYVVANPYWNIPESIMRGEIAPQQAEDPGYLASKNMEVVRGWNEDDVEYVNPARVNWASLPEDIDFRVRQRAGPTNALGLIKFMFPNEYAVYLHDSPAEALFERTTRTFSHGCIRVEDPRELAEWVLAGTEWEGRSRVDELIDSGDHQTVRLTDNIPVYVSYFTVWTDEDGEVKFLNDVYDRDDDLKATLSSTDTDTVRHVARVLGEN